MLTERQISQDKNCSTYTAHIKPRNIENFKIYLINGELAMFNNSGEKNNDHNHKF